MTLTPLQKRFIEEYAKDYNAIQAYIRANPNKTTQSQRRSPYIILKKPEAQEYLQQVQLEAVRKYGDIADLLIKELAEDVVYRDEDNKHSPSWSKSADLLQKQLGLQKQNIKADVEETVINVKVE